MNPTINQQATGLQVFYNENENVSIRTEVINNEPWFVAKDVAMALSITWSGHTLDNIPEEWQGMVNLTTPCGDYQGGGLQSLKVINESAMYKLAFRSNKPEADRFVNWIAGSVLPSIRRTGTYSSNGVQPPVEAKKKLPLPKYRSYFDNWKGCVKPYLSYVDVYDIAKHLSVSYSHACKVYAGTAVSERIARALTNRAMDNNKRGVRYEEVKPVYEQLSVEWEKEVVTL